MKVGISTSTWFQDVPICSLISEKIQCKITFEWPNDGSEVWDVCFEGTFLLESFLDLFVRAPEMPFSRCKKLHKMRKRNP